MHKGYWLQRHASLVMSFQRRLYTPVPHSHYKSRSNLLVVNTVGTNSIETACNALGEEDAQSVDDKSTTILDIDPNLLTRAHLVKWATHYPHIKSKSTSTANLLQLYLTIERQNLESKSPSHLPLRIAKELLLQNDWESMHVQRHGC